MVVTMLRYRMEGCGCEYSDIMDSFLNDDLFFGG